MCRVAASTCCLLFLLLTGCARDEDYLQVMREQEDNMKELAEVLETVRDEKSLTEAKISLQELRKRFDQTSQKAKALPNPPPKRVVERMQEQRLFTQRIIERLQTEVRRISKLPGGPELWKQFEPASTGLFSAGAS